MKFAQTVLSLPIARQMNGLLQQGQIAKTLASIEFNKLTSAMQSREAKAFFAQISADSTDNSEIVSKAAQLLGATVSLDSNQAQNISRILQATRNIPVVKSGYSNSAILSVAYGILQSSFKNQSALQELFKDPEMMDALVKALENKDFTSLSQIAKKISDNPKTQDIAQKMLQSEKGQGLVEIAIGLVILVLIILFVVEVVIPFLFDAACAATNTGGEAPIFCDGPSIVE